MFICHLCSLLWLHFLLLHFCSPFHAMPKFVQILYFLPFFGVASDVVSGIVKIRLPKSNGFLACFVFYLYS
jgi:hypothetical protein